MQGLGPAPARTRALYEGSFTLELPMQMAIFEPPPAGAPAFRVESEPAADRQEADRREAGSPFRDLHDAIAEANRLAVTTGVDHVVRASGLADAVAYRTSASHYRFAAR